jgi:DNA-directed RNA polymerase specialized sigma24 family protein
MLPILRLELCTFENRERAHKVDIETFLKARRSIRRFRFKSSFRSWLFQIAMGVCVAELKKEECSRILS